MDEKIVIALQELKDAVARQSGTWHQHAASLAIMLVVTATSAYMGSYLEARGENAAIADNLEAIKHQLAETTRTAESIKSGISKKSELNSLRVKKMEELFESFETLKAQHRAALGQIKEKSTGPNAPSVSSAKVMMLAEFYFPDVADRVEDYVDSADFELTAHWLYSDVDRRELLMPMFLDWADRILWTNTAHQLAAEEYGWSGPYEPTEAEMWGYYFERARIGSVDAAYEAEKRLIAAMRELLADNVSP
ncbi:MAG: hypothetical protein ACN6O5_15160 [Achromobacter sp.]|uniref:hypothetical protein n=1 Tax=Achromobacter sp. TaxID=134375 RepID=UPI003D0212EF